jgi:two-component system sensor histidine kinase EvgS
VAPNASIEHKISIEQCRLLYQNLPFNSLFHVTAGFILCAILWTQGDRQKLLFWWSLVAMLSLARVGNYYFYRVKQSLYSTRFWNLLFGVGSLLIGLLWGMAGVVLTPHEILSYELFVGFVIAGMVVGAVPVLSSVKGVYLAFAFAAEVPYIAHLASHKGDLYIAVATIHGLFLLLILLMTTRMYTLIRESLLLRFYNVDLVEKLQGSNELLQEEVASHEVTGKRLWENEQRLGALVDATFEGILLHKKGTIIEANRGLSEMTGYSTKDLIGSQASELIAPAYRERIEAYIQTPDKNPIEVECLHREGKQFPVEIRAGFVPYKGEQVAFVVARDITYYKELLKTQAIARQKAEEADQSKTEFLAAVSHELRTPLNAMMGFTQLLQDTELDEQQKEYLAMTYSSGEQLLRLINDLLDLSRIESGRFELDLLEFNLLDELNEILNMLSLRLTESGNVINVSFADDLPQTIVADPYRLRQIIINLLGNAIKFTDHSAIEFSVFVEGEKLVFIVKDYGKGIPEDKLEFIFGKFNQVDSSVSREHGGAGLGLAISKRLVEAMQGDISVTSTVGEGTTFRLELPLTSGHSKAEQIDGGQAVNSEQIKKGDGKLNILLVEDDKTNQMIAIAMLQKFGHRVSIADNGAEAVARCSRGDEFDVIFMDIQMPVMDGITATQRLREQGLTVPIIAMTANAMTGDRDNYLKAGMNDYISKPIYMESLAKILQPYTGG